MKRGWLFVLALGMACTTTTPTSAPSTPAPTPTTSPTPSPSPSPSAAPSGPAVEPTRGVLFRLRQRDEVGVFRAAFDGSQRTRVGFPQGDPGILGVRFSPDGERIAWRDGRRIMVARFRNAALADVVARVPKGRRLGELIWASDGSRIAYASMLPGLPGGSPEDARVFVVDADGSNGHEIDRFDHEGAPSLMRFDATHDEVWWMETGEGGYRRNLTIADARGSAPARTFPDGPGARDELAASGVPTDDGFFFARYGRATVDRFDPATGRTAVFARLPGQTERVERIVTSPSQHGLLVSYETTAGRTDTAYVDTRTGKLVIVLRADDGTFGPAVSWSPDGRYVFLDDRCCTDADRRHGVWHVLDLDDRSTTTFFTSPDDTYRDVAVTFLTWLR